MRKIALLRGNKGQAEVVVLVFIGFLVLMALAVKDRPKEPAHHYTPSYTPEYTLPRTYTPPRIYTPPRKKTRYKCAYCNGRGLVKCSLCSGRGGRYSYSGRWWDCVSCGGTGLTTCLLCNGLGYTEY